MKHYSRGGALVEFAMVAPIMLVFLIGTIEFGTLMFDFHATDYAAKLGARYASVRGADCVNTSVCPISSSALQTYLRSQVPGLASNAQVTATWTSPPASFAQSATGCGSGAEDAGCLVEVQVTNQVNVNIPFVHNFQYSLTSTSAVVEQ
jgi:Flp pilus assembly protein TadG